MFTGLIEALGEVTALESLDRGIRLRLTTEFAGELTLGESVATNGVCLTVVETSRTEIAFDLSPETLEVTTLGSLVLADLVNLERPLRLDGRLGGHLVQGHVDAVGRIYSSQPEGEFWRLRIGYPRHLAAFLVHRGSIAVDGISLTIAALDADMFDIQVVPHTWTKTNLQRRRPGDGVNLECDLVGKYVVRNLEVSARISP
jgi:riboflavin synthase